METDPLSVAASSARRRRELGLIAAIRMLVAFQLQAIAAAAPLLIRDAAFSHAEIGMLIGAYMLPGALASLGGGYAAQRLGDRAAIAIGLGLMAAGGAMTALSPWFAVVLAGRFAAGFGGVAVNMLCVKMAADRAPPHLMATATALMLTMYPLGLVAGSLLLPPLAAWAGISPALALPACLAFAAIPMALLLGAGNDGGPAKQSGGWPARVFWRPIAAYSLTWMAFNAGVAVFVGFLAEYLATLGHSGASAGARASLCMFALAVMTMPGGYIADWSGKPAMLTLAGSAAATLAMALTPWFSGAPWILVLAGAALALPPGPIAASLARAVPVECRAVAFGCHGAGSALGIALAPPLAGWLRDVTLMPEMPLYIAAAATALAIPFFLAGAMAPGKSGRA